VGRVGALGVILSAVYMLWLVQRTFYGDTPEPLRRHFSDLSLREWAIVLPLVALMVWMGVYSQTFCTRSAPATTAR